MEEEDVISLTVLIEALKKGIWWIILFATLFTALTVGYVLYVAPTYQSSLKVLISPIQNSSSVENLLSMSTSEKINTEVALATSNTNLMNALNKLDLSKYTNAKGISFADEEFTILKLKNMVSVSQLKDTREVVITVTSGSPEFAADYANALGESFRNLLSEIAKESKTSQRKTIEEQIPVNEENLAQARDRLAEFMNKNETSQMSVKEKILTNQIANIQLQKQPLSLQFAECKDALKAPTATLEKNGIQVSSLEELKKNQAISNLLVDYKANCTEVILYQNVSEETNTSRTYVLSNSIDEKKKELINSISKITAPAGVSVVMQRTLGQYASAVADYLTIEAKMEVLAEIENSYNNQLAVYLAVERQLEELKSEVAIYESLVLSLKQMLEETRVMESSVTGNVTVVDPAKVEEKPIKPEKKKTVAIGFLGGCVLGYALSLFLILLDTTAKCEEDVKKILGPSVPSLGWIPYKAHMDKKSKTPSIFVANDNASYVAERYRILTNNIVYSTTEKLQTIVFTSSDMSEGKTTATVNAATTYALLGKKVLVIDGDFRYSILERIFNLKHTKTGIADVLVKHVPVKNCIIRPLKDIPTLHFLPQGYSSANPNIIYNSQEFKDMMAELKGIYDYIFVDCPPISYGSDFSILAKMIDGYVYITRAGISTRAMIEDAKKSFPFIPAPLLGFILYGVAIGNSSYGYSYGYGSKVKYGYSYGYGYNGKKEKIKTRKSYQKIHKEELKNRTKSRRYGDNEPVFAFLDGSDGFTTANETISFHGMKVDPSEICKKDAKPSALSSVTDDMLADIEGDMGAKGGTNK